METPPSLPPSNLPLETHFLLVLLAPIVAIALGFWWTNQSKDFALPLLVIGACTVICSAILAGRLSTRMSTPGNSGVGFGILFFFAFMAFYFVCFFIGCTASVALG